MSIHPSTNGTKVWMTPDLANTLNRQADAARVNEALSSIAHVLQNLVDEARTLIGAHDAGIRVALDEQWTQVVSAVSRSEDCALRSSADRIDSLLFPIPRPLRLTAKEMIGHPAWRSYCVNGHHPMSMRGILAVPLVSHSGRNFGLIDLTDKCDGEFTAEDEENLLRLCKIASLAVENAWLYQGAQQPPASPAKTQSFVALQNDIGEILTKGGELRHTLDSCVHTIARHFSCALARIWVLDDGILELHASAGFAPDLDRLHAHVPVGLFNVGLIAQNRKARLTHTLLNHLDQREREWFDRAGLTGFAGMPLLIDDGLHGVLALFDRKPLSATTLDALAPIAMAIALHIKRNRAAASIVCASTPTNEIESLASEHAVVTTSIGGEITTWNHGAETLFGYSRSEAIGRSLASLMPTNGNGSKRNGHPKPIVCQRKDGSRVDVCLTMTPMADENGHHYAVVVAHDLTPQKQLEQQYRQAQRMETFGQLAGGVAHDFNNLLTVILGYTEILIRRNKLADPTRELLSEIHKAGSRAETLTRQLLSFTRKQALDVKVLDLNAVISETERMLRRLLGENIAITTIFAPKLRPVKVDAGQIEQILLNLAINARDAMPKGGHITIETNNVTFDVTSARAHTGMKPGEYVMLAVSDTGVGMNADTKARIFEPLFTTKSPGKGTGLGLATVRSIVRHYGGHIDFTSELGRGTEFKIYLPRAEESLTDARAKSGMHALPRGTESVLLAEDDDCVRSVAKQVLEICGYRVLEAARTRCVCSRKTRTPFACSSPTS